MDRVIRTAVHAQALQFDGGNMRQIVEWAKNLDSRINAVTQTSNEVLLTAPTRSGSVIVGGGVGTWFVFIGLELYATDNAGMARLQGM